MPLPDFDGRGDLPPGVHQATLPEIIARFGAGGPQRQQAMANLLQVYQLAQATGKLERFLIFGSYVTAKPDPNDVDIFLVLAEDFEVDQYTGETGDVFSHSAAQHRIGMSVFGPRGQPVRTCWRT
jgi:hypothetical protein